MNAHKSARTTPLSRAVMLGRVLEEGWDRGRSLISPCFDPATENGGAPLRQVNGAYPRADRDGITGHQIRKRRDAVPSSPDG
jgi:hypothetical protein